MPRVAWVDERTWPGEKPCSTCKETKKLAEFDFDSQRKGYKSQCKACIKYRRKVVHRDTYLAHKARYRTTHRAQTNEYAREYIKQRCKTDPTFKITCILRNRLRGALATIGAGKVSSTLSLLGCEIDFFAEWLKFMMEPGMSFENHGEVWHLDHCIPCDAFNLSEENQQKKCFHWTNIRPMFAKENLAKSNKRDEYEEMLQELYVWVFEERYHVARVCDTKQQ